MRHYLYLKNKYVIQYRTHFFLIYFDEEYLYHARVKAEAFCDKYGFELAGGSCIKPIFGENHIFDGNDENSPEKIQKHIAILVAELV